ncbi:Basement membrane proteoglycan [Aphelenchoides fujianensis]|nr:Basement membrane proteoglycan [Aphelenchoides fujianensis]
MSTPAPQTRRFDPTTASPFASDFAGGWTREEEEAEEARSEDRRPAEVEEHAQKGPFSAWSDAPLASTRRPPPSAETVGEAQLRIVGEMVVLRCDAPLAHQFDSRISWEKVNGSTPAMPQNYRIDETALIIPRVRKDDAGVYRCFVEGIHGELHSSAVELKVGDYVPTFNGNTIIEVTPLEADEWQRIEIELSVRPTQPDGTLYHAERTDDEADQPQVFHNIALRRGHVVYSYDIGGGAGRLQSNDPVEMNQWSKIVVKNNPSRVSLNVNGQETNNTNERKVPVLLDSGESAVFIGGMSPQAKHYGRFEERANFKGSISRLLVNEKLIDIGESATSPPELTLSLSSNECFEEPCQNGGFCAPAHEHEGYRCECDAEFSGSHCQFRTRVCTNKMECAAGVCVDGDWGANHCVCPWRRHGARCELERPAEPEIVEETPHKREAAFKFNGQTSFLAVPAAQSSRHFRLSMTLRPNRTSGRQLIAYVGSGYNARKSDYMALTIENDRLIGTYKTRDGREQVRSLAPVQPDRVYQMGFLRSGKSLEIRVDGQFSGSTVEAPVFASGTELFVGGLPPGMRPHEELAEHEFFRGCIGNVHVNRELVDLEAENSGAESGDLQPCTNRPPNSPIVKVAEEKSVEYEVPTPVYESQPKLQLHASAPEEIIETGPDDALFYTVIHSTRSPPLPPTTTAVAYKTDGEDESVEYEVLSREFEDEETTTTTRKPPTRPSPPSSTTSIPRTSTTPPRPTRISTTRAPSSTSTPRPFSASNSPALKPTELVVHELAPDSAPVPTERPATSTTAEVPTSTRRPPATTTMTTTESPPTTTEEVAPFDEPTALTWRPIRVHSADATPDRLVPEDLCQSDVCGPHGTCEPINITHVACSCRDYFTGPNCDEFKPIENAARFEGNAFIVFSVEEFPHLTSERREIVEFELRTNAEQGVIFWQGQSPHSELAGEDYMSVGLNDGHLVFSYELGGGAAQLVSAEPVNDGKVHRIRAERQGRNGTLKVDNSPPLHGKSSGILAMLNVEGNIYLGGLPNLPSMTAGLYAENFVGCVADFRLNERKLDLMANAIDGRNVKPCEEWEREKRRWFRERRRLRWRRQMRRRQLLRG